MVEETPKKEPVSEPNSSKGTEKVVKKSKQWSNPALRALGIPKIGLPSRNWMIFWCLVGSIGGGIFYDKYEQKQMRKKWMGAVEHMGEAKYQVNEIPRKLTIFIAPAPNDYLDKSLKHFRKFIKPVLNSGGIEFDVVTEERQGDIRNMVAERIREIRREAARREIEKLEEEKTKKIESSLGFKIKQLWNALSIKKLVQNNETDDNEKTVKVNEIFSAENVIGVNYLKSGKADIVDEDLILDRAHTGGVICVGRGVYKEYLSGIHEGLLGPLEQPKEEAVIEPQTTPADNATDVVSLDEMVENVDGSRNTKDDVKEVKEEAKDDEEATPVTKPYIAPADYAASDLAPELNFSTTIIDPTTKKPALFEQPVYVFNLPNLTTFSKMPKRMYNFFNRRKLADEVGEKTAAILLNNTRPFNKTKDILMGKEEELNWPSKWVNKGLERNSEWVQEVIVDERVATRLNVYEPRN